MTRTILTTIALSIFTLTFLTGTAHASQPLKPKFQTSATPTLVLNWDGSGAGGVVGAAVLVVPVAKTVDGRPTFLRIVAAAGALNPFGTKVFVPTVRGLVFVGFTPTKRMNVLAGAGLVATWKPSGFEWLPVGAISANFWLVPKVFSVNFPTVLTRNGVVLNAEFILTFPAPKKK